MHSKLPYSTNVTGALPGPAAWSASVTAFLSRTISEVLIINSLTQISSTIQQSASNSQRIVGSWLCGMLPLQYGGAMHRLVSHLHPRHSVAGLPPSRTIFKPARAL